MRIVSVGPERHPGLWRDGKVLDLVSAVPERVAGGDVNHLLDPDSLDMLRGVAADVGPDAWVDESEVVLGPPVPAPGAVFAIGLNYRTHAEESGQAIPDVPTVFTKFPTALIGPEEAIVLPPISESVDYEGELAVVIGRGGRDIAAADALAAVAGLTICNDVSARDHQFKTSQWSLAKSFDTFCPLGPALVTLDEIPDPNALHLVTRVNGEVLQDASTADLIFPIPELIAYLSQFCTLRPGDVISTGTPAGVGVARQPPRFLRDGDVVEVEIDGIGVLRNPVVR